MQLKNTALMYLWAVVVSFGSFIFGYSLVCISMMADKIHEANPMPNNEFTVELSTITTLLPLGAFIGVFLADPICNRLGENKATIVLDIFAMVCFWLQGHQLCRPYLYIGRFLVGMYTGINSNLIPVYLISISPPQLTGIIGTFNQLFITLGIAVAYGLGMYDLTWSTYMMVPVIFCALNLGFTLFMRFDTLERHYRSGERDKLQEYVNLFYENGSVEELESLRSLSHSKQAPLSSSGSGEEGWSSKIVTALTSNAPRQVVTLAVVVAVANQFSGINAIIFYAKQVFEHITNGNKQMAQKYSFGLGVLQVIVTFISGFLINRFGRRTLMLSGMAVIVLSLIGGAIEAWLEDDTSHILLIVVFAHIVGFSLSLGPVGMLYIAQIMENVTLAVCVLWILTLFVSMISEIMIKSLGIGTAFFFYGVISLMCLIYLKNNMVESRGLSRDKIVSIILKQEKQSLSLGQTDTSTEMGVAEESP